jgi:putative two-component system response regulator
MTQPQYEDARILIVDDEPTNVQLLERVLRRGGYQNLRSLQDPREVLEVSSAFEPDLVLLDLHMPHMDGFAVLAQLRARGDPQIYHPILVLTADASRPVRERALSEGAKDFLTKPLDTTEVLLRVRNLLETRFLHIALRDRNVELERRVKERTHELEEAYLDTVERLARAGEYRDDTTGQHAKRLGESAGRVARAMGLPVDECEMLELAAPLHDIGKIGIPDSILLKPDKLTPEEFEQMREHTTMGVGILEGGRSRMMQIAEEIAMYHHERWDGGGYRQLKGEAIPLMARIVSVVDTYDAITNARPYREARTPAEGLAELAKESGKQFDPEVVAAFLKEYAGEAAGA